MTRRFSPGPSWAVLAEPTSSSPTSPRTSFRSDVDIDPDMGDDESEHGSHLNRDVARTPISKRKAPADDSAGRGKLHKVPRLDLDGSGIRNPSSRPGAWILEGSSSASSPGDGGGHAESSRTQPASSSTQPKQLLSPDRGRATQSRAQQARDRSASTNGETTSSDFSRPLSQSVRKIVAREKERERAREENERERERGRKEREALRHRPQTARKTAVPTKNVQKVSTQTLLKEAQRRKANGNTDNSRDVSRAWTRIRPKFKAKRTNYDLEMGHTRPLDTARERGGDVIELTDSSDSSRPRPSQPARTGPRPSAAASMDDPIIITDGSGDERRPPRSRPTLRRPSGPGPTQGRAKRSQVPPPAGVEVISLLDESDEDMGNVSGRLGGPQASSGSTSGVHSERRSSQASASQPKTVPAPAPAPIPQTAVTSLTSTQLPEPTPPPDAGLPPPSPAPSYGLPTEDFENPFNEMDFDAAVDDADPSDGWDGLDLGPSLATLPVPISSTTNLVEGADADIGANAGGEDMSGQDALFDSFVNMDQLGGQTEQQENGEVAPGEARGDGLQETDRDVENGASNDPVDVSASTDSQRNDGAHIDDDTPMPSLEEGEVGPNDSPLRPARRPATPECGEITQSQERSSSPSKDGTHLDGDVCMGSLEEGEVDPNAVLRRLGTPESGEITQSQETAGKITRVDSIVPPIASPQPVPVQHVAPTANVSQPSSSESTTASSASPHLPASQSPGSAMVMPDLSAYEGLRFKRPNTEKGENPFFSRALGGLTRPVKAPVSVGERQGERDASSDVSTPADVPSRVPEMQSQDGDTSIAQDGNVASMPETSKTVAPVPTPLPPAEIPMHTDSSSMVPIVQVQSSSLDAANGDPLPLTQPTPSYIHVVSTQPSSATQPFARSSSRPFIAPPRIPRVSTPKSLVDTLNEVRDLTRRNMLNQPTEESTPVSLLKEVGALTRPQSAASRVIGKTPSLNDIRALRAKWHTSGSQPARSTTVSTPTPTHESNDDGDSQARTATVPLPMPAPAPATTPVPPVSTDGKDDSSTLGATRDKSAPWSTPTPSTSASGSGSGSGAPPSGPSTIRRAMPFKSFISPVQSRDVQTASEPTRTPDKEDEGRSAVPFESFISPVQSRHVKTASELSHTPDRENEERAAVRTPSASVDGSPKSRRFRVSMGSSASPLVLGTQRAKGKGRASMHSRRESAAFEAYIVRESPMQTVGSEARAGVDGAGVDGADANAGTDEARFDGSPMRPKSSKAADANAGTDEVRFDGSPVRPKFSKADGVSAALSSMLSEDPAPVVDGVSDVGREGVDEDVHVMDVDERSEDVDANMGDSMGVDDEMAVAVGPKTGTDETDTLLELASVHLSLQETEEVVNETMPKSVEDKVGETEVATKGRMDPAALWADDVQLEQVDHSHQDFEMGEGDKAPVVPLSVDVIPNILGSREENTNTSPEEYVAPEVDVIDARLHTTPELLLPEGDAMLSSEPASPSKNPRNVSSDHDRIRRPSGDSVEECDAILALRPEGDSEPEEMLPSSASSRTASSTSLAVPRARSRSSRRRSARRSLSRSASSADPLDLFRRPTPDDGRANDVPAQQVICGHPIQTWTTYVARERERPPEYKLARDLPHSLQDHMNYLPVAFRNSDVARRIFEAHIRESSKNEPDAPAIEIFDNDIGNEATPQWEFHYTNEMWYSEGVPPPDVKGLKSCTCVGRCDPKSGNCACSRRQLGWIQQYINDQLIPPTWPGSPFVYDSRGLLQRLECPIFECNQFCGCDEDCPNRVVQNGRKWPVHIARTLHKGWGVIAGNKKIPKGSYLGIYAGELLTEQEGEARGRYYDLYGRTYLFSIDFHHLKMGLENEDDWENLYVVDAYHAGNFTRFLNHSCDPNCKIFACHIDDADVDKPLLAVFTIRDVEPWEELCFSYYGDIDEKREEIEAAREAGEEDGTVREHAVYAQCRCDSDNCIGRLFG